MSQAPKLKALDSLSPSLFEELRRCRLRAAYRVDEAFSTLRRPTPFTALGEASHQLAERVARGEFDQFPPSQAREALETAWKGLITARHKHLCEVWSLAPVPPPERWPGYQHTRVRLLRSLELEVTCRRPKRAVPERLGPRVEVEVWLEPSDLPLRGRVDRVEITGESVHIIDLKTSWAYGTELHESHRQQLLLYAALWRHARGEWPRMASVQTADGTRLSFEIDPDEARDLVQQALNELATYNAAVQCGTTPVELASPSAESCSHCPFRAVCEPFFYALKAEWGWYPKSILGSVMDVAGDHTCRTITLSIRASNLETADGGQARVLGIPPALAPTGGEQVAIVDAFPTPLLADVKVAWSTQLVLW